MVAVGTFSILAALVSYVVATPIPGPTTGCAAVHVITARGSTEAAGEGSIAPIVNNIVTNSAQTVTRAAVNYPATLIPYDSSKNAGVTNLRSQLAAKVAACPNIKIVLVGYSQGYVLCLCPSHCFELLLSGHVVGDVFAANATGLNNGTYFLYGISALHLTYMPVAAAIITGDPAHVAGETFQKGTGNSRSGLFARAPGTLDRYASKLASYCDLNDLFCAGGSSLDVHGNYTAKYGAAAAALAIQRIGG